MKKKKILKIALIILFVLILIIGILVGCGYYYLVNKVNKINTVDINEDNIEITSGVEEKLTGYRNIALFGIDSRENNYELGNRSDCIMIASINNDTKEVKLVSVYRDTYLEIPNRGLDKVTHAYSYGGSELAISTLNSNLDLNITEFVTVNFDAVIQMVDSLGGIEIEIAENEVKYLNDYIVGTSESTGILSDYITQAGKYNLNGVQAVAYSRIRYTEGGDYKRAERMRTVLTAIVEKAKSKSVTELNSLLDNVLPKIYTNINSNEIISLLPKMISYNITGSEGWPYEIKGITLDRWYGVPVNLENNVSKLHEALFTNQEYEPSSKVKEISNKIIKKTGN